VIVLDTNVLSELAKPEPAASVLAWLAEQRRAELCTTAVSEAEIAYGLALLPKGRRRDALAQAVALLHVSCRRGATPIREASNAPRESPDRDRGA